jgi:hypothetical protein
MTTKLPASLNFVSFSPSKLTAKSILKIGAELALVDVYEAPISGILL